MANGKKHKRNEEKNKKRKIAFVIECRCVRLKCTINYTFITCSDCKNSILINVADSTLEFVVIQCKSQMESN